MWNRLEWSRCPECRECQVSSTASSSRHQSGGCLSHSTAIQSKNQFEGVSYRRRRSLQSRSVVDRHQRICPVELVGHDPGRKHSTGIRSSPQNPGVSKTQGEPTEPVTHFSQSQPPKLLVIPSQAVEPCEAGTTTIENLKLVR